MLTNLKDEKGKIICYVEWRLVGPSGLEVPSGDYVWVNDIWVHEDYRFKNKINRIIDEILRGFPQIKFCYFQRGKYGDRMKMLNRSQLERLRKVYDVVF